jgi:hypothetical protein
MDICKQVRKMVQAGTQQSLDLSDIPNYDNLPLFKRLLFRHQYKNMLKNIHLGQTTKQPL